MPIPGADAMNTIPEEKRNHLALVAVLTLGALAALWFGPLKSQRESLRALAAARAAAAEKLQQANRAIEAAGQVETQFREARSRLDQVEQSMAAGDLYAWAIGTVRDFRTSYK